MAETYEYRCYRGLDKTSVRRLPECDEGWQRSLQGEKKVATRLSGRGRFKERKRWQQGCPEVQRHKGN